ncbi:MAG: Coenzyme F420 hydrogenase/dehydrogenase, beta subunit C-terminal domain [Eubacteriales bacterium]|nr:Coenzyme F420 hydrogenase/dehydrogenase, beta subunit C-terminal domain [Eubacteriales bacterium]
MSESKYPITYAVKHIDNKIRFMSRSGGVFTAISDYILSLNGVIYGCVLDDELSAIHYRAESSEERDKMRGSKYIQSSLSKRDIYKNVIKDLENDRKVLFTGTSCQVAGLLSLVSGNDYRSNLYTVDILCHGVPSPLVWKEYINWQEKKHNKKIVSVNFRNKEKFGWRAHVESLSFENGDSIDSGVWRELFYSHLILRPSCYECIYKSIYHMADITIADYWGIENAVPESLEFDDDKGVSLVMINNEKGKEVFDSLNKDIVFYKTSIEESMQMPLIAPFPAPVNRDIFWQDFYCKKFDFIAKKYASYGLLNDIKRLLMRIKRKIIKR